MIDYVNNQKSAELLFELPTYQIREVSAAASNIFPIETNGIYVSSIKEIFSSLEIARIDQWLMRYMECDQKADVPDCLVSHSRGGKNYLCRVGLVFLGSEKLGKISVDSVTDRNDYFSNIHDAKQTFQFIQDALEIGFFEVQVNEKLIKLCRNAVKILAINVAPNAELSLLEVVTKEEDLILSNIIDYFDKGRAESLVREFVTHREKKPRYFTVNVKRMGSEVNPLILGTIADMSAQRLVESQLRQRESQLGNLIKYLPEGIVIIQGNEIVFTNEAADKMFAIPDGRSVVNESYLQFIDKQDLEGVKERVASLYAERFTFEGFIKRRLRKLNGKRFFAEVAAKLINYNGSRCIQLLVRDLTKDIESKERLKLANTRLKKLTAQTIELQEKERKRIAGELHDDIGQSLTAIKLASGWLLKRVDEEAIKSKVSNLRAICEDVMNKVRNLSLMLRPAQLDSLGLPEAIAWQAEKILSYQDVEFDFDYTHFQVIADEQIELTAFRVVQESLTNVAKHANANNVRVELKCDGKFLLIQIVDDGKGFNTKKETLSLGLVNMKERVELVDGTIDIVSIPRVGTTIDIKIPLPNKSNSK